MSFDCPKEKSLRSMEKDELIDYIYNLYEEYESVLTEFENLKKESE